MFADPSLAPVPAATPDGRRLRAQADRVQCALKLLAHPDRLQLVCALARREMCVGELEDALDIHQPTLSQQLGVLRAEGAVRTRRQGKHIFYSLADPALVDMLAVLDRIYCSKE